MKRTKEELTEAFRLDEFPRSAKYDPEWVIENLMGPNVLWLTESLSHGARTRHAGAGHGLR